MWSIERAKQVIFTFKPFKSPGTDGIYPIFLQKTFNIHAEVLCKLFETSLLTGFIPNAWRRSNVIFIPKMGNRPSDEAKSLRAITKSSMILKKMEKNIEMYIRGNYLVRNRLHFRQYAYQEGKSAIHAVRAVKMKVEKAMYYKNIVAGLAIDKEGAFDNTKHEVIKRALMKRNMDISLINWIDNMLRTRKLFTELNGAKIAFQPTQGCPQRGNLSPLLWSLVIDELIGILNNSMYYTEGLADDLLILIEGCNFETVSDLL